MPEIYNHNYDLKNIDIINDTYGQIYKGKIPNIFFGHFFVSKEKTCLTQRYRKKLVTFLYYRP